MVSSARGGARGLALAAALLTQLTACSKSADPVKADAGATGSISADHRAQLEKGEVVVTLLEPTGGDGIAALARAVVDAPVAKVWPVVRDCQHFQSFMPRTKESRVSDAAGDQFTCYVEIEMPFPLSNLKASTRSTVRELPGGGHERRWALESGDYERNSGSWTVKPWAEGKKALLEYRIDVKPNSSVPDAIARRAQSSSLPEMFDAIRQRAR
jgi:ribosome-associated toxin RatA of RatAB toxin-antitoxin module